MSQFPALCVVSASRKILVFPFRVRYVGQMRTRFAKGHPAIKGLPSHFTLSGIWQRWRPGSMIIPICPQACPAGNNLIQ